MRFHIIRHGQTDWNVQRRIQGQLDSELNELGITQAIERGKDFSDMPIMAAYCSSSLRTRQTILNMFGQRDIEVTYMDEFREVNFGVWQGRMWSDVEQAHPDMVEAYTKALPHYHVDGAETPLQTQSRGVNAFETLIQKHPNGDADANVILVSHGAIIRLMLAHYAGIAVTELHKLPPLPNCSHCIIETDGDQRKVTQISSEPIMQSAWSAYVQ